MKLRTAFSALVLCTIAVGCGPSYERHEVTNIQAGAGGSISPSTLVIRVPEGAVLTADLVPYDSNDDPMPEADVATDAPDVLEVMRVASDSETHFAFVGRRAGETTVRYFAEGREVRRERATVTER